MAAPEESSARRAGRLVGRRRRRSAQRRLEWPELRSQILSQGGIGPDPAYDNSDWQELGLYRERGKAPDEVAAETFLGRADQAPWQGTSEFTGDPDAMLTYLRRARQEYQEATPQEREASKHPLGPRSLARRRELRGAREEERRRSFGTTRPRTAEEQREHARRMSAFIERARAARRAKYARPAVGFYTDDEDVVHPITSGRARG